MSVMLEGSLLKDANGRLLQVVDSNARAKVESIIDSLPVFSVKSAEVKCYPTPNVPLEVISHVKHERTTSGDISGWNTIRLVRSGDKANETISVSLPETLYEGYFNWSTGVLTSTATLVVASECTVTGAGTSSTGLKYVGLRVAGMSHESLIVCNRYPIIDTVPTSSGCIRPVTDMVYIYDNALDLSNPAAVLNGVKFLFANKRTSNLGAREIIAAEGENVFTSNTGDTEVSGKNSLDYISDTQLRYVTPEMFGAAGDGIADDTAPLTQALKQTFPVLLTRTYAVSSAIDANAPRIIGCGATIKLTKDTNYVMRLPSNAYISNVTIDCENQGVLYGVYAPENVQFRADCVEVKNIKNTGVTINGTVYTGTAGIYVAGGVVTLNDIIAHDIYSLGNGVYADAAGAAYGVNVNGADLFCANGCVINDCHTIDASGAIIWEDSSAMYFTTKNIDSVCRITNCRIVNPGKYGLKIQSSNVGIYGTYISNALDDYHAGIALLPVVGSSEPTNAIVHGCHVIDSRTETTMDQPGTLINIQSNHVNFTDCIFDSQMIFAFSASNQNTTVGLHGCKIKGRGFYGSPANLTLNDCDIEGRVLVNQYQANTVIKFVNCQITRTGYGANLGTSGDMYLISNGRVTFDRCTLSLIRTNVLDTFGTAQFVIRDCSFEVLESSYSSYKFLNVRAGTSARVERCTFRGTDIAAGYLIYNAGDITLDGCEDVTKGLLHIDGGTVNIRNMPIPKLEAAAGATYTFRNVPYYSDVLPTGVIPEGALALLTTDGKLYRYSNGNWT